MRDILLIEDEELLSSAFKAILEKDGNNVKIAKNGRQALEILETFRPETIFLDLHMPVMDGIEFLQEYQKYIEFYEGDMFQYLKGLFQLED